MWRENPPRAKKIKRKRKILLKIIFNCNDDDMKICGDDTKKKSKHSNFLLLMRTAVAFEVISMNMNRILDEGTSTSTGNIALAVQLSDLLVIPFVPSPLRVACDDDWRIEGYSTRTLVESWYLTLLNTSKLPTTFMLDDVN